MATTSHNRSKARRAFLAQRRAVAAIVAANVAMPKPPKSFAPNGLATARTPWGDRNARIGSVMARADMTGRDTRNSGKGKKD